MSKKIRKSIPEKLKRVLQKEINSICPFCENQDVDHFQIHHIDEIPSNNELTNLLMLCPTCHSKITKGDISEDKVRDIKENVNNTKQKIEFASVIVSDTECSWIANSANIYAFYYESNRHANKLLVLNWSFINHLPKTIILTSINYAAKSLPSGISGLPQPSLLESLVKYKIPIECNSGPKRFDLKRQIEIPEKRAFQFQTEIFDSGMKDERYPLKDRLYIDFTFEFSSGQVVKVPRIFLNCKSEKEKMIIRIIG